MKSERWQEISRIFEAAKSLSDDARVKYLVDECKGDESLRKEVEQLIDSHQKASAESFIGRLAVEDAAPILAQDEKSLQTSLRDGQQFGSYLIIKKLGAGGMGEVYLAKDNRLDRTVALKILPPDVAHDKRRMQRFRQEARVASSLNQTNILTIFEFGDLGPLTYLATEFVDGETLRDYLHGKRLKLGEVLVIGIQILAALDAAHEAKIVHRDIKPENVMIRRRDRVVKVLDFGLAKLTEKKSSTALEATDTEAPTEFKSAPGTLMGTINYMSPEQAQTKEVDQRTDIWSTGVILYEMLAGEMPFKGPTAAHTIVQILEREPPPLTQLDARVPAELQRIVSKAMAKNAGERYQTARDMLIDLNNLRKQLDVQAEIERSAFPLPVVSNVTSPVVTVSTAEISDAKTDEQTWSTSKWIIGVIVGLLLLGTALFFTLRPRNGPGGAALVATPPAIPERNLVYSITVQKYRDNRPYEAPFQLSKEILFERDYRIRLNINSSQSGFLYVLNEGPHDEKQAPEYVVLFPSPTSNAGSAFVTENHQAQIPEKTWFHFDNEKGTEKVWLIFASGAIPELDSVRSFANPQTKGLVMDASVRDRVHAFLKNHAATRLTIRRSEERKETALAANEDPLVYPISLEHQ